VASTHDVVAALGVSYARFYRWLHDGVIRKPARKFGSSFIWSEADIEAARQAIAARQSGRGQQAEGGVA